MQPLKKIAILFVVALISLIGLWQLSKARSFQVFGDVVARVDTQAPMVALTFDDGPSKHFTYDVLEILADHKVRGTFYVTGHEAEKHFEQIKKFFN